MKLVGEESVEAVGQGVNPVDPNKPGMHLWFMDHIARVHNQGRDEESRNLGCAIESAKKGTNRSKQSRHNLSRCEHKDLKESRVGKLPLW